MSVYNDRFREIGYKYHIYNKTKLITGYTLKNRRMIRTMCKEVLQNDSTVKNVAIVGRPYELNAIVDILKIERYSNINLELCENEWLFVGIGYDEDDILAFKKYDIVIVATECHRHALEMAFIEYQIQYFDLYDELEFQGYTMLYPNAGCSVIAQIRNTLALAIPNGIRRRIKAFAGFNKVVDSISKRECFYYNYDVISVAQYNYANAVNFKRKKHFLSLLIEYTYQMKMFDLFESYILEYNKLYGNNEEYLQALIAIKELVEIVECKVKKRKQRDIIVQWLDCIPSTDVHLLGHLDAIRRESYEFKNVYAGVPYTHPVFKSIYSGKGTTDVETLVGVQFENSELVSMLNSNDYAWFIISNTLDQDACCDELKNGFIKGVDNYIPTTLIQWLTLTYCAECEKSIFIIAHSVVESHPPFFWGEMNHPRCSLNKDEYGNEKREQQLREQSLNYLSRKVYHTHQLLGVNSIKIYMSDHGRKNKEQLDWLDSRSKSFLFIQGNNIKAVKECGFFQSCDLFSVIERVVTHQDDFSGLTKEYCVLQGEDKYSPLQCEKILKKYYCMGAFSQEDIRTFRQYRGVVTNKYKYIAYPDEEIFLIMPEERIVNEDDIPVEERVKLKKMAGDKFIDIYANEKYNNIMSVYQKIGLL